jgi:SAM-dependent methyltransferase
MSAKKTTSDFFDAYAGDFDAIYGGKRSLFDSLIDYLFRRSMRLRFEKTIDECHPVEGKIILDVGCGSGHYGVTLIKKGIIRAYGIDAAPAMIEIAEKKANIAGVSDKCEYIAADFLTYEFNRKFDYTIIMGFMDYVDDPSAVIDKVLSLTISKAFFSFPVAEGFLAWQRRRRYQDKCDLFLYRLNDVEGLFKDKKFKHYTIDKLSRDYFVTVRLD